MLSRRRFGFFLGAIPFALPAALAGRAFAAEGPHAVEGLSRRLAGIEAGSGGRLGVAILDLGTGLTAGHRANERFPLCSTFKLLASAAVLARVDAGSESLERRVPYSAADLVPYSPVTGARVGEGAMPLSDLCEAAITQSDNTAGNLLLGAIGGPAGFTAYARGLGDTVTRLDRLEPDLNEAAADDPRDTTSPAAMLGNLRHLVIGHALSEASKARLTGWLLGNRTGGARLRAHLPAGWRVGDKTGSGEHGTTNDAGIVWPATGKPILVAAYLTGTEASADARNATLAEVGQALVTLRRE